MKRPSFFHGVIVAAVFAFFASAVIATLTPFVGFFSVRSKERVGRVTTLSLWSALAAVTWWLAPPLPLYLLIHVGAMWLVRSLYFYSGVLPALMDLGLSALSITAAVWAITQSGSVFLATWCFFLVQALFVAIPPAVKRKATPARNTVIENEPFERARRLADQALTQLFNQ